MSCQRHFRSGEKEGSETVGIVEFAGAGIVIVDVLFDVGADANILKLAVGRYFARWDSFIPTVYKPQESSVSTLPLPLGWICRAAVRY